MKVEDLIHGIDEAYCTDASLMDLYKYPGTNIGDGLAEFIYNETMDIVGRNKKTVSKKTIVQLRRTMETAVEQIRGVYEHLCYLEAK